MIGLKFDTMVESRPGLLINCVTTACLKLTGTCPFAKLHNIAHVRCHNGKKTLLKDEVELDLLETQQALYD